MPSAFDTESVSLLRECREKEFHAYGTSKIFERRAKKYRWCIKILTFLGIVFPVLVGGVALAFGVEWPFLTEAILGAALLGLLQLVMSVWAVVDNWSGKLEAASNSLQGNVLKALREKGPAQ